MATILEVPLSITTTGSAGSATGSTTTPDYVRGWIEWIHVAPHASLPTTADLTITEVAGAARTLLTITNITAAGTYYVRAQTHTAAGVAATYDGTRPVGDRIAVAGHKLTASLAQADALTAAAVITICISQIG